MKLPSKIKFTAGGLAKVRDDFAKLTERRKGAIKELQRARELGDLSENGAYKAARFEVNDIDRELRRLKYLLRFGEVTEKSAMGVIGFGCKITVDDGKNQFTFTLVDGFESDPNTQKLSIKSPIGRALLGKRKGDKVVVTAPAGQKFYTIVHFE